MSNIVAISTNDHTYMARIPSMGRVCKIWRRDEVLVGASCNTLNQLHRIKSFVALKRIQDESTSDYAEPVWKTHMAAHLIEQIDSDQPDVRFELLLAKGKLLYLIKHLPEAGGYASIRTHHRAATQYWGDADLCEASFALTKGEDVVLRLAAALATDVSDDTARRIETAEQKIQVFVT